MDSRLWHCLNLTAWLAVSLAVSLVGALLAAKINGYLP
jgi:hypothetical protein